MKNATISIHDDNLHTFADNNHYESDLHHHHHNPENKEGLVQHYGHVLEEGIHKL